MTDVEQFLASRQMFRCERLNARLTEQHCESNRRSGRVLSCDGCPGLESESMAKRCVVPGCEKIAHRMGHCWTHEKSVLGIDPATGKPLSADKVAKVRAKVVPAVDIDPPRPAVAVTDQELNVSVISAEIDALFASKRAQWMDDLSGATTLRSRAKMFLAMADAIEGMVY